MVLEQVMTAALTALSALDGPTALNGLTELDGLAAPDPDPVPVPGLEPVATMFLGWAKWVLIVGGVLGMMICGGMMILGRRNRSATAVDGATGIPWVLGGLTLGAIAATVVGVVLE